MNRGGVTYVCKCYANNQPPDCRKESSSGPLDSAAATWAVSTRPASSHDGTQAMLQGLLNVYSVRRQGIRPRRMPCAPSRRCSVSRSLRGRKPSRAGTSSGRRKRTDRGREGRGSKEGQRTARQNGLLSRSGTGLRIIRRPGAGIPTLSLRQGGGYTRGGKSIAPKSAAEQARCAAYFSDEALKLAKDGKREEAEFMSRQVPKAMAGEPTDVPCQGAAVPTPDPAQTAAKTPGIDVNAVLEQYSVKIQDLFAISQRLAEVRKKKIDTQLELRQANDRIAQIQPKAASVTKPEEKQEVDDLLRQALASKRKPRRGSKSPKRTRTPVWPTQRRRRARSRNSIPRSRKTRTASEPQIIQGEMQHAKVKSINGHSTGRNSFGMRNPCGAIEAKH